MDVKLFKLVLVFIMLQYVFAQQISELKCEESLLLSTDPQSLDPHLMEILKVTSQNETPLLCSGTLISEDFILTAHFCSKLTLAFKLEELKVRKAYVFGDHFTDNQRFNIKRMIPYDDIFNNNIGLVELKETVPYHDSVSVFRPACLWTETVLPSSLDYRTYGRREMTVAARMEVISLHLTTEPMNLEDQLLMFVNSSLEQYILAEGSPIETYVRGRNYVVGIYSIYIPNFRFHTTVGSHIAWIESIVWPVRNKSLEKLTFILPVESGFFFLEVNNCVPCLEEECTNNWIFMNFTLCGRRIVKHKTLMAYSLPTYHGEYPWHVALYRSEGDSQKYICGGTIINNRTVITAAHCVTNELGLLAANRLRVVAGIHNLNEYTLDTQTYFVESINVHHEYNRHYLENDIALVKLNDTIRFTNYIQPICFGNNSEFNTTVGRVAGWGHDEHGQPSQILLQGTVPVRSNKDCRRSNRDFFHTYLNDYNYCGGYQNGTNVCSGDSGGGMIFEYKSRFYIRGIVSVGVALPGSSRCDVTQMVLFTDVPKFYNWIIEN